MGGRDVIFDFMHNLAFSKGISQQSDMLTLQKMIVGCVSCRKTTTEEDKDGNDYVVTLRKGTEVKVDAKTRRPGCSRYWGSCPELALELWSVRPGGKYHVPAGKEKAGWTLDESKETDLMLFTFHPEDSLDVYLVSFQLLRLAFLRFFTAWCGSVNGTKRGRYRREIQETNRENCCWESECVFVPVTVVFAAIEDVMQGKLILPETAHAGETPPTKSSTESCKPKPHLDLFSDLPDEPPNLAYHVRR